MHIEPRPGHFIDRIYLHLNEGPQQQDAAWGLKAYLSGIDAGYHVIVDNRNTVRCAADNEVVWGEGGDNQHCLSLCMIGYSASNDWSSPYSVAMVERAAQQVAAWCKAYNIPAVHVRPGAPGQAPTDRGIAEHADDHRPESGGHTDPGAGFPLAAFIARVQAILAPPIDWHGVIALEAWGERVIANPLTEDLNPDHPKRPLDTAILRGLLRAKGYDVEPGTVYGPVTVVRVHEFKVDENLPNHDGHHFGALGVKAILS
jgi:hypothetical protein